MEEWKDINGYEGIYQISSYGRVKSIDRVLSNGKKGKIVAQDPNTVKELGECILDILDHACLGQMTLYYKID